MSPNATKHLLQRGLQHYLSEFAQDPHAFHVRRWQDGSVITSRRLADIDERYGAPYRTFHRPDLHNALYRVAEKLGVQFKVGHRAVDYDFLKPAVTFENGASTDVDFIVAADGEWRV